MSEQTSSEIPASVAAEPPVEAAARERTLDARVIDIVVRLAVLGLFAYFALQLVAPFFLFLLWAVVLTAALYPAYAWLAEKLGGRKVPAAILITLVCLAVVIGPVAVLVVSLSDTLQTWYHAFAAGSFSVPAMPQWLADLPVVGAKISELWQLAGQSLESFVTKVGPMLAPAGGRVLTMLGHLSASVVFFIVSWSPG